jgi:hypothetical protein
MSTYPNPSYPNTYPKYNRYQPSKPVFTANSFEGFEEKLDDASTKG